MKILAKISRNSWKNSWKNSWRILPKQLVLLFCLSGFFVQKAQAGLGLSSSFQEWNNPPRWTDIYPTIDYRAKGFHWQLNLLDTIQSLTEEDLLVLSGTGNYLLYKEEISPEFRGVGTVGIGLGYFQDIQEDQLEIWMNLSPKMGVELGETIGMGLYLVPSVGGIRMMTDTIQHQLLVGGGIQISVWSDQWP